MRNLLVFLGVAAIMLILGVALGSTIFVMRTTQTIIQKTTQTTVQTTTQTYSVTASNFQGGSSTGQEIMLIGACNATEYVRPDTAVVSVTNITTVNNHTTTIYASTTIISATLESWTSNYTTTLITNTSTHFFTTNTSEPDPGAPAPELIVAVCTFAP